MTNQDPKTIATLDRVARLLQGTMRAMRNHDIEGVCCTLADALGVASEIAPRDTLGIDTPTPYGHCLCKLDLPANYLQIPIDPA